MFLFQSCWRLFEKNSYKVFGLAFFKKQAGLGRAQKLIFIVSGEFTMGGRKKTLFPKRLKQLRESAGLKQEKVAGMLNYGSTAISNYESGRNEPCIADLISIADFFGVSVDYLIGHRSEKEIEMEKMEIAEFYKKYDKVTLGEVLRRIDKENWRK